MNRFEVKSASNLQNLTQNEHVIVALGDNKIRAQNVTFLKDTFGINCSSVVHPKSTVDQFAKIEQCVFIAAGAYLEARCSVVEDLIAIVLLKCIPILLLVQFCQLIVIGSNTLIGANSTILSQLTVGNNAIVSAEYVVTRNVAHDAPIYKNQAKKK